MTFLPIVERELRVAARHQVTYWLRLVAAGLALFIWFLLAAFGKNLTPSQRAEVIFWIINSLSLGFAILAGAFLTADCLSAERREGTLGLLFLTDLRGHDVVLGKLASTSVNSVYGLLAVVPTLAVPLLMGGVTPGEIARAALVLLLTLFLSLSAGMFVSAISYDSRVAFLRTLIIMVLLSGLMPVLWWGQRTLLLWPRFDFLLWCSPGYAMQCAGDVYYSTRGRAGSFWTSLLVIGGLGLGFLVAASLLLPRIWRQAREETGGRSPASNRQADLKKRNRAKKLLESNPYLWLATRDDRMGRWTSWIVGGALVLWSAFYVHGASMRAGGTSFAITLFMAFGLHALFKCLVAAEATRRMSEDRQSGALELLLVSPLRPADIITGHKVALNQLFGWPRWMLTGMNLLLLGFMVWPGRLGMVGSDRIIFMLMFAGGIALLFADFFVIAPVGAWSAITTKHHMRAILKTLRQVMLPSWVTILFFWLLGVTSSGMTTGIVEALVVVWAVLGLAFDAVLLAVANRQLQSNFREQVATGQSRPTVTSSKAAA